ncbi:MAG: glycosyltransferase [SAR202 cluster bacterium]|nr:glycosyltransferase [SAR202 cluster bacterium]
MARSDNPLPVLHVLGGGLVSGGNETAALNIISRHLELGFNPVLVALSPERDSIAGEFERLGIPIVVFHYQRRRPWRLVQQLAGLTRRTGTKAVMCYSFSVLHAWVHLGAALGGAKRRITRVAAWPPDPTMMGKQRWVNRLGRPFCTLEVAVSQHVGEMLTQTGGYPAHRIVVIPNGCDVAAIRARADVQRGARPAGGPLNVLMVARMDDAKDQDTLIRATALVRRQLPDVHLVLAGDGPRRPVLEALAREQQAADLVTFLGTRRDIPELLGQADVFVLATHTEGFGIALIEAMAAGVPVIASDIPACREILEGGKLGRLAPDGDAAGMAQAIQNLLDNQAEGRRLAILASCAVQKKYSLDSMAQAYAQALEGSLGPA